MIHPARHSAFLAFPLSAAILMTGCDTRTETPATDATRSTPSSKDTRTPAPAPSTPPPTPSSTTPPTPREGASGLLTMPNSAMSEDARLLSFLHAKDQDEVRIGKLAQGKATSADAKAYADMLVKDHGDHDEQVMAVAKAANITLTTPPAPAGDDPTTVLGSLSGAEFDRKFGELMTKGHQEVIQTVEAAQPKLTNAEVKSLVEKTLPVLRHHLEMAQKLGTTTAPTPSAP
jgi:putative membrane protein